MININSSDFAYFLGNFMADGSFYQTKRKDNIQYRFEFVDGSPYAKELKYSLKHILKIKQFVESILKKSLGKIRKRENRYILSFRSKVLSDLFLNNLKMSSGDKSKIVDLHKIYKNTKYEKDFWIGYLDGDGSISRQYKKISLESMSHKLIDSFSGYLNKNNILHSKYKSKRGEDFSYVVVIRSVSFKDFVEKIGFSHPLKAKLLREKLKLREFFIKNSVDIDKFMADDLIDYTKIFGDLIFIENGRELLIKYDKISKRQNVRFSSIISLINNNKISKKGLLLEVNNYRFKKSKGSTNSVKLPLISNEDLSRIAKYVRIRAGGISFSKRYIESFNENFNEIIGLTEKIFDIKPKYTCKKEPLFCSGVLADFFSKIIRREN